LILKRIRLVIARTHKGGLCVHKFETATSDSGGGEP
jgi:hypothetical protein